MKLFGIGIFLLFVLNSTAEGHKILGVFPTPWKSHWNVGASVLKQLARAGHDITFVSPFELREPNVRNVILTNYPDSEYTKITMKSKISQFSLSFSWSQTLSQ